jgi:hypothetical protein
MRLKVASAPGSMARMIGQLHHLVIDCPDPLALAAFYADPAGHPFCLIPRPTWAPPIPG